MLNSQWISSNIQYFMQKMQVEEAKKYSYLDEFRIIKTLGAGYHAQVKLAVDDNGDYFAIKKYKKETASLNTLKHQLDIMKNLDHENLVRLVAVRENATYKKKDETTYGCFAIILEYVGGGELFDFIAETGKFNEKVTRTYFHQMMNGLYYMHKKGYAHRDIKPQNILLSHSFILKLADFGFSCLLEGKDKTGVLHTKLGTEGYMAPEIPTKNYEGAKVDIFASGVILFIMYAGNPPFEKAAPNDPYYKLIKDGKHDTFWKAHSRKRPVGFFSNTFKDLFMKTVDFNPKNRPSIEEIATHPWVKQPLCTHSEIKNEFSQRQARLDAKLEETRKIQEQQKAEKMEAIKTQCGDHRGETEVETEFLECYNTEVALKRELVPFTNVTKDMFAISEESTFAFATLKRFFNQESIIIDEDDEENSIELRKKNTQDEKNEISITYAFDYGTEEEEIEEQLGVRVRVGKLNDTVILEFIREEGNLLLFKKVVNSIKQLFSKA